VAGIVFGATLLASLALGGSAFAQEEKSVQLKLTPNRGSGVSGTATLTNVEGGVKVELTMKGLPEQGVKHTTTSTEVGLAQMTGLAGPHL
jgi:hypothetical protein